MIHDHDQTDRLIALARTIAIRHGLTIADLRGSKRTTELANARAEFAFMGKAAGASYPQLGRTIGKHHTTMILGARRWKLMIGAMS